MSGRGVSIREALFLVQLGRCYICGHLMDHKALPPDPKAITKDHILPRRSHSGRSLNVALACFGCNQAKAGKRMRFVEERGMEFAALAIRMNAIAGTDFHRLENWSEAA